DKWNRRALSTSPPTSAGVMVERLRRAIDNVRGDATPDAINHIANTATDAATALEALSAENERLRKALDALDRMNRGLDWCDQDEQARRWSAARRALAGGE